MTIAALASVDAFYRSKVAEGRMAGIVYTVAHRGEVIHTAAIGHADRDAGSRSRRTACSGSIR